MKKTILVLFVLGFVSMNGYAQKVYMKDGKVYLECTVASGMPAGSITTTPKCATGTASNTTFRNGSTTTNNYASENDEVFEKLEIDNADYNSKEMDWVTVYVGCKSKNTGGVTGWRLPTQRELMLMYIFRDKLGEMTGNAFSSRYYWSSLENVGYGSYYASFENGHSTTYDKTRSLLARCVREVMP